MKVGVIGAAGHVGFPFSLVVADAGHEVIGLDKSYVACHNINNGIVPYIEEGAQEVLDRVRSKNLLMTNAPKEIQGCDVLAIMVGTPVDEEGNPRLDDIIDVFKESVIPYMKEGALIILRSTVSPGTTELVRDLISRERARLHPDLLCEEGHDYFLVFCPERVSQGYGIKESKNFHQLVGAFSEKTFLKARDFFATIMSPDRRCYFLTPQEAEIGKLMTNMYRYVNFALANEFYMIGNQFGANIHKVIEACNADYPRLNIPPPGPNVGGPCLFKDGKFLLNGVQYADLIQVAFMINEGMPEYLWNEIIRFVEDRDNNRKSRKDWKPKRVAILGTGFKANSDDERNSLSFKFAKVLKKKGVEYDFFDPYSKRKDNKWKTGNLVSYDTIVIMTPHKEFIEFVENNELKLDGAIIADVWKLLPQSKETKNGIYIT